MYVAKKIAWNPEFLLSGNWDSILVDVGIDKFQNRLKGLDVKLYGGVHIRKLCEQNVEIVVGRLCCAIEIIASVYPLS